MTTIPIDEAVVLLAQRVKKLEDEMAELLRALQTVDVNDQPKTD